MALELSPEPQRFRSAAAEMSFQLQMKGPMCRGVAEVLEDHADGHEKKHASKSWTTAASRRSIWDGKHHVLTGHVKASCMLNLVGRGTALYIMTT